MNHPAPIRPARGGLHFTANVSLHLAATTLLAGMLGLVTPGMAQTPPWVVNHQAVADYTPLEIKMGYYDDAPGTRIGIAALYTDGQQNIIDVFDVSVEATGIVDTTRFASVDTGQIFGLGEICIGSNYFLAPYIKDFNVGVLRWDGNGAEARVVDDSAVNHTNTDCFRLGASYRIASLNFDLGRMEYFESADSGLNWSLGVSYSPDSDFMIGPFSGGFRPKSGALDTGMGEAIGTVFQRASGPLEAVALDATDGAVLGSVDFDEYADHGAFIDNGHLKECDGRIINGYPVGICNGGNAIGLSYIDPVSGQPEFELLNSVAAGSDLDFQGLSVSYNLTPDALYVHSFSSRHARVRWDLTDSSRQLEEIPGYTFADIGGPVATAFGDSRLFVAGAGFPDGTEPAPVLSLATLNPDPDVMIGQPLGPGPGGPDSVPVPSLNPAGLAVLVVLMAGLALVRLARAAA